MKKFLTLILTCFCVLMFSGCANCTYSVEYLENGEIVQSFSTHINKQDIESSGYSYENLIATINNLYATYWANKQSSMLNNLNNNNLLSAEQRTAIFQSVSGKIENTAQGLQLKITYPSSTIANLVNTDPTEEPSEETEESNIKIKENLFTRTQIQILDNAFVNVEESDLYKELKNIYVSSGAFSEQDLTLQHIIAFSSSRYKSNATKTIKQNNLTYHIWELNSVENENGVIENPKLEIYLTQAKPLFWYVLAVIITGIFIGCAYIIIAIKQKTTKKV